MGKLILIAGLLMTAALIASQLAGRLRVPALLLFLGIGMAIGSDGLGLVEFEDYELARDVGIVALALILLEGGLTTNVGQLRELAWPAVSLALLGTLLTALITGFAAALLLDLPFLEGLLLGAIVASTDAAAVFALLRTSSMKPRLARLLEGEAGANDPVAILLVIGFIDWLQDPAYGVEDMLFLLANQLALGAAAGLLLGWLAVRGLKAVQLPTVGLYPVASLTAAALAFGVADVLGGSGFLAVYLVGLVLASAVVPAKRTITAFHVGLAWVAQLTLFLTLGLLVFPSQLGSVALEGILLALILAFVARPIATVLATALTPLSRSERIVLGWAGLRGAVPVVLATFPVIAGIPDSLSFFNVVFFSVVFSLVLQGPTFEPLARRLQLTSNRPAMPEPIAEIGAAGRYGAEVVEYRVAPGDAAAGARVRDLALPREAIASVILRGESAIPPRGSTRLHGGDDLFLLVRREALDELAPLLERWRVGPLGPPARPGRNVSGAPPVFIVGSRIEVEGDPARPDAVAGRRVAGQLRIRRDVPGALVVLDDSRYAITGPIVAVGPRRMLADYARRRITRGDTDERAWLQSVIGVLAVDVFE
jgi:cell volume regulation protein A